MGVKQYEIWLADLEPRRGTETGKVRPVLVVQTDMLNKTHPSTIICPITTNVQKDSEILRVHIPKGISRIKQDSDIMIDQIRAIDNRRLIKKAGNISMSITDKVKGNIKIILDLED